MAQNRRRLLSKHGHMHPYQTAYDVLVHAVEVVGRWTRVIVLPGMDADLPTRQQAVYILLSALFEQAEAVSVQLARLEDRVLQSPHLVVFRDCMKAYLHALTDVLSAFSDDEVIYVQRRRDFIVHGEFSSGYAPSRWVRLLRDGSVARHKVSTDSQISWTNESEATVRAKLSFTPFVFWPLLTDGFTRPWLHQVLQELHQAEDKKDGSTVLIGRSFLMPESGVVSLALVDQLPPLPLIHYRHLFSPQPDTLISDVEEGKLVFAYGSLSTPFG